VKVAFQADATFYTKPRDEVELSSPSRVIVQLSSGQASSSANLRLTGRSPYA